MKLLLDAHISPRAARRLRARGVDALALAEWEGGAYQDADDETLLEAARRSGRSLVSFDRLALPLLLKGWVEAGRTHGGVIFPEAEGDLVGRLARLAGTGEDLRGRIAVLL